MTVRPTCVVVLATCLAAGAPGGLVACGDDEKDTAAAPAETTAEQPQTEEEAAPAEEPAAISKDLSKKPSPRSAWVFRVFTA